MRLVVRLHEDNNLIFRLQSNIEHIKFKTISISMGKKVGTFPKKSWNIPQKMVHDGIPLQ